MPVAQLFGTLVLWPPGSSLYAEGETIEISDDDGGFLARVGEEIRLSGGEISNAGWLNNQLREPLPAECPGPYWLTGSIITRDTS